MADRYPEKVIRAQAQDILALRQYIATLEAELEKYETSEEHDEACCCMECYAQENPDDLHAQLQYATFLHRLHA